MILEKVDEPRGFDIPRRRTAPLLLPGVVLALVEKAVFGGRHELLRRPQVIRVVRLTPAGERDHGGVMPVVVPEGIQTESAFVRGSEEADILGLVFADDERPTRARRLSDLRAHLSDDVDRAVVVHVLRCVETQAIEMELLDPVARIRDDELAYRLRLFPVEVDRRTPVGLMSLAYVVR